MPQVIKILQALLTVAVMAACGGSGDSDRVGSEAENADNLIAPAAKPSTPEPAGPDAEIPLDSIGLVDPKLHSEGSKGEWQGEVFNELALAQLKSLGKKLEHPEEITAAGLEGIVLEGAQTAALVPVELKPAFQDSAFTVRRSAGTATDGETAPIDAALAKLVAPFDAESELRSEFKIFSVQLGAGGEPECDAYFQLTGRSADGTTSGQLSRRARWHCTWHWPDAESSPLLKSVRITEFEETLGRTQFADCSAAVFAGVDSYAAQFLRGSEHWAGRLEGRYGIGISGWHGMAIGDANGDGLDDLYVCEPGGLPNRLYVAKPDGTVFDASAVSGTDFRLQSQAALFVDLDNDGDQDLVIATTLGVIFMANDGAGAFVVKSKQLVPEAPPVALAAADFDLDGDLDIYTGCYSLRRISTDSSSPDGAQFLGRPIPYHDANNGGRNVLLRNDRNWRFKDVTREIGLDENNRRYTFAPTWEDFDDDGDPDLYVANDYGRNNLYRNDRDADGNSKFTDVAAEAGVEDISAGMSASWGDADGDGDRDLYVSNMWSSAGNRIAYQRNFQSELDESKRAEFQRHARGNSLFINNGDGTFSDTSLGAGVTMGRWAWGSRFADINNDGNLDIVVANGFITQPDGGDL